MKREVLLYGDTNGNSDMLYFTGLRIPDPFFAFTLGGRKCALLSPLEAGRASRGSNLDEIFDISETCSRAKIPYSDFPALCKILKSKKVSALAVAENFPSKFYADLCREGFDVEIREGQFFPEREIKTERELREISRANSAAAAGFAIAEEILRLSKISRGRLLFDSRPLTCEFLRAEIEKAALSLGADSMHTIVAAGDVAAMEAVMQRCDPNATAHNCYKFNALGYANLPEVFVRWLIDYGTDIGQPDQFGNTPLIHQAANRNGAAQIVLYLQLGADITANVNISNINRENFKSGSGI
mgnify:CR=1 FL=1